MKGPKGNQVSGGESGRLARRPVFLFGTSALALLLPYASEPLYGPRGNLGVEQFLISGLLTSLNDSEAKV
jgi:hypothetical protein